MCNSIVTEKERTVNPFSTFKAKVEKFAAAIDARADIFNDDGDQFIGIVYTDPVVRIYGRPGSTTVHVKRINSIYNPSCLEIK